MSSWQGWLYVAAVFVPLAAFAAQFLLIRLFGRLNAWIATGAIATSFVLSTIGLIAFVASAPGGAAGHEAVEAGHAHAAEPHAWTLRQDWVVLGAGLAGPESRGADDSAGDSYRRPGGGDVRDGVADRDVDPPLLDGLHGGGPGLSTVLRVFVVVLFLDAGAGGVVDDFSGVCVLGAGGALLVPVDWLLV